MRIAINYFRTALGVGLSLMTMELIISLGTQFLQNLVQQTANSTDLGQMLALTVAVILLGVLAHRIPQMISGMVTGSGHNGSIGAAGLMSAIGAAFAASNIARGLTAGGAGAAAAAGSMNDHHAKLLDRLSVLSEASGAVNGSETSTRYNSGGTGRDLRCGARRHRCAAERSGAIGWITLARRPGKLGWREILA